MIYFTFFSIVALAINQTQWQFNHIHNNLMTILHNKCMMVNEIKTRPYCRR